MIITIKGADFSSANIGTLSTYIISKSIGSGAAFDIPNFVDKNSSVNWTITLDEGYTFGTYSITMGGVEVTPTVVDNVMTISIAEVTGNVRIVVATINENTDEPTFKEVVTIDIKNIPDGVDILPTDTQYHVDNVAFSTRYWTGDSTQTDSAKRGIYYLETFPFNETEYLSCCIDVEEAVSLGYTKLNITKTNVTNAADSYCYYNRRTSNSTTWTEGKETTRTVCSNNTTIDITGYKSIYIGLRRVKAGETVYYSGEKMTFTFSK